MPDDIKRAMIHYLSYSRSINCISDVDAFLQSIKTEIDGLAIGVHIINGGVDMLCVLNAEWGMVTFTIPPYTYNSKGKMSKDYNHSYYYCEDESVAEGDQVITREETREIISTFLANGNFTALPALKAELMW